MDEANPIHDAVAATLGKMGVCAASTDLLRTVLIRDGHFLGHKFRFEGGYAVWIVATNVIEVYGDDGKPLKTVALEATEKGTAA